MRMWPVLILLLLACATEEREIVHDEPVAESAAPERRCRTDWQRVADGIEYRDLDCPAKLHLVRVDPRVATLDAVMTPPDPAVWPFALNANFFDQDLRALGLVVSNGKVLNPPHPVKWQSFVYVTRNKAAGVLRVAEWEKVAAETVMAAQAGPRLIVNGARNEVARARPDRRAGVCIDAQSRAVFFATPQKKPFDVWQMVDLAAGLGCRDAMLFDGGPSVQMHVRGLVEIDGDRRVPVFVVAK